MTSLDVITVVNIHEIQHVVDKADGCCWLLLLLSAPTLTLTLTFAVEVTCPGEVTPPPALVSWKDCVVAAPPPPVRLLNVNGHVCDVTHTYEYSSAIICIYL